MDMNYLCIEEDGHWIHIAKLQKKRNSLDINLLKSIKKGQNVKQFYIPPAEIISLLSPHEAGSRVINLKPHQRKNFKKMIAFQMDSLSKEWGTDLLYDYVHVEKPQKKTVVYYTTTKSLRSHLKKMNQFGLDPHRVTSISMSLVKFTNLLSPKISDCLIIHLGRSQTFIVKMTENLPTFSWSFDQGLDDFIEALCKDIKNEKIDSFTTEQGLSNLNKKNTPTLYAFTESFKKKLSLCLEGFLIEKKIPLLISGSTSKLKGLDTIIESVTKNITFERIQNTFKEVSAPQILEYATSIGAVLDAVSKDHHSIQFRQNGFHAEQTLKKFFRKILYSTASILFFSIFLTVLSSSFFQIKKRMISDSFYKLIRKDEKILNIKTFKNHSYELFEENLKNWKATLKHKAKTHSFISKAPNVSEVFTYFKNLKNPGIQFYDIQYFLEKYPSLENKSLPYRAKISLMFEAKTPLIAKEFYKELHNQKKWIDLKKGIVWESLEKGYRATFYLKPKYKS